MAIHKATTEAARGETAGGKREYRVPALEKGLDILEYLSDASVPQSQAELSRALDRSPSELFRMLMCLEQRGYILRDESSNKYRLSLRLYELAHIHTPSEQVLLAARAAMRHVAQTLRESCHIGILRDDRLIILAQEESPEPLRFSVELGRPFPAILTSSGRLLLAQLAADELDERLSRSQEYRDLSESERSELHAGLRDARREQYVAADSDLLLGVRDVSVLIGNPKVGVMAALAVPALMTRGRAVEQEGILATLREQAEAITRKLGLTP
jgi:DNA-binding IclR family transcriptional regulator